MPHPNFVPVSPSVSRIAHSSGVSGSTSSERTWPLTVMEMAMRDILRRNAPRR